MISWPTTHRAPWAVTVLVLCGAGPAAAGAPAGHLANVKRLYQQLYFNEAMTACQAALQAGGLSRADLLETLRYQGLIAASTGREAEAVDAFKRVLAVDPEARLGRGHAPRIRRAFEAAKRWLEREGPIRLEVRAPRAAGRSRPIIFSQPLLKDPLGMVHRVVLQVRAAGRSAYTVVPPAPTPGWRLEPSHLEDLKRAAALEYFLVATDRAGSELVLVHSAEAPARVMLLGPPLEAATPRPGERQPERPAATPLVRRWWFWTAIGAGMALAAGLGVGLGRRGPASSVDAPVTLERGP